MRRGAAFGEGTTLEYFFYCRDRPGTWDLRLALGEDHWAFMDRYAEGMIARGPTFTPDGAAVTGSMHLVDLPDADAAREFAFEEPNYKAGVYGEVLVRRWRNVLGRTMWEFEGETGDTGDTGGTGDTGETGATAGYGRFLIVAHAEPGASAPGPALDEAHHRYLDHGYGERLIAYGPLLSEDGTAWRGTALLAELPDRSTVEAMMADEPYARNGLYESVEIHAWRFGGRPAE